MVGVCFWHVFRSAENEFVVKKIIKNHGDTGGKTEDAGRFDKIVVEWDVEIRADIVDEFVKWCDEAKEPGEEGADGDGSDAVPDEEHNNTAFSDGAFFPGDFRMENIGEDGSKRISDDTIKPKKLIAIENYASEKSVNSKIEECQNNTDDSELADTDRRIVFHQFIIACGML